MKKALAFAALAVVLAGAVIAAPAAVPTIRIVKDAATLPPPFARIARAGDMFISDGGLSALIAGPTRPLWSSINYGTPDVAGYVAAFLPAGAAARPDLQFGYPVLRVGGKSLVVGPASIRTEGNTVVARSTALTPGGVRLDVAVRYAFAFGSGRIDIAAEVRNAGAVEVQDLSFGLGANSWQSYSFSPYDADRVPSLNIRVYERPDHAVGWHDPNPASTAKKPLPGTLRPGAVYRRSYAMVTSATVPGALGRLYRAARVATVEAALEVRKFDGPIEVIVRETTSGAVFFRTFLDRPAPLAFPIPAGAYAVRANLFPAVVERTFVAAAAPGPAGKAKAWAIEAPASGRVRVVLSDGAGRPVRGKVSFIGLAPTATPYFRPENPIATGRSWETLKDTVYPPAEGLEVTLPAGTYLAFASHGPEFGRDSRLVEVLAGEPRELRFTIDRAVATPGLVSIDPHMHTLFSDGSVPVAGRLLSAAAEGLDVVVSADHNRVTDYRDDLRRTGLAGAIAFVPGAEVTVRTGSVHFNMVPAAVPSGDPVSGSIGVGDETPATLFAAARAKNPGTLIQLNHPRSGTLGYFNNYHLDPEKGAFADAPFDPGFDIMEAMNGAVFGGDNGRAIEDWFHLVNRGYPVRIVGSSDAHGVDGGETGYSRTYVLMAEPVGGEIDPAMLAAALRKGAAFVSNGPIVAVRAGRKATFGDVAAARKGRVDLDITVTGAPWLDVSEVRLIVDGERRPALPLKGADGATVKFRDRVRVEMPRDGWIAVEVVGGRSLYPMLQQRSGDGSATEAALPYAITNPIFIDANADGRVDPVWPEKIIIK